jgi:NADPH:quinone reductase-like Zn-dependent oxidoreductase
MKAVITTKYGAPEVLEIREVANPIPKKNEVLIKIRAIAVTSGDCRMRAFNPPFWYFWLPMRLSLGIFKPRKPIQGIWLSGEIVEKGTETKKFSIGQQIYARTLDLQFGANAEYICLPENSFIATKPKNLLYEEAVSIPFGALTAMFFLNIKTKIKSDDKLLVYGASGSVGIATVQLAKHHGAEVYAVCSMDNIELVKNNGADYAIDYTKQNLSDLETKFDIVFDAVGKIDKSTGQKLLKENGKYISVLSSGHVNLDNNTLETVTEMAEKGILKPVVDKIFPFEQIVEAHKYVDKGHKKGNVAIKIDETND